MRGWWWDCSLCCCRYSAGTLEEPVSYMYVCLWLCVIYVHVHCSGPPTPFTVQLSEPLGSEGFLDKWITEITSISTTPLHAFCYFSSVSTSMNTVSVKKTSNIQVAEIQITLQDDHHLVNNNKCHENLQDFVSSDNQRLFIVWIISEITKDAIVVQWNLW